MLIYQLTINRKYNPLFFFLLLSALFLCEMCGLSPGSERGLVVFLHDWGLAPLLLLCSFHRVVSLSCLRVFLLLVDDEVGGIDPGSLHIYTVGKCGFNLRKRYSISVIVLCVAYMVQMSGNVTTSYCPLDQLRIGAEFYQTE